MVASWFELFKSMSPMILSVPADMGYDQYTKTHPCSFVATSDEASNDFTLIIMKKLLCVESLAGSATQRGKKGL